MSAARKTRSRVLRYTAVVAGAALLMGAALWSNTLPSFANDLRGVSDESSDLSPTVTVAPTSPVVSTDQATISVSVRVDNHAKNEISGLNVSLSIDRNRVSSADQLSSVFSEQNPSLSTLGTTIATGTLDKIAAQTAREQTFDIPVSDLGLNPQEAGVYALSVGVNGTASSHPVSARSTIVWGNIAEPMTTVVTAIVPLLLPSTIVGLAQSEQLAELTAPNGLLSQSLNAAQDSDAIIAVDPRVIASIRILADDAPATAKEWLRRLASVGNATFALQFSDADLAAQSQLGFERPLTVKNLDAYDPHRDVANRPTSTDGDALTVDDLTRWQYTLPPTAWPADAAVTNLDLDFLNSNGFSSGILGSNNVTGVAGALSTPKASIGLFNSMIVNSNISAALTQSLEATNSTDFSAGISQSAAELALLTQAGNGAQQHILVAFDRTKTGDSYRVSDTMTALKNLTFSKVMSLSGGIQALTPVDGQPPTPMTLSVRDQPVDSHRLTILRQGITNEDKIVDFSSVLETPQLLIGTQRAQVLNLFSAAFAQSDAGSIDQLKKYLDADNATLHGVSITQSQTILAAAAQSDIPVQVSNSLPFAVKPVVKAGASNNRISITDPSESTRIEAKAQSIIKVPIEARVSNGEVTITVSLSSESGISIGTPVQIPINIRAQWETIGIIVMTVLVAGFLGFGAWRSVRNRRKKSAMDAPRDISSRSTPLSPTDESGIL